MDYFKKQLDQIQQQLGGLSASQKMLAGCLVFIIVMTVMIWGKYAAEPEMEAVFKQALEPEELRSAQGQLRARNIPFTVSQDSRLMVPSDRVTEAIAELTFSQTMPKGAKIDFAALVKDMNPFNPHSINEAQLNNIKQLRLAEVISNYPGVRSAQVFIDPTERVRIGGGGAQPSATVSVEMKRGQAAQQQLVDSAAGLLVGAQAGLSWQRVSVIVDGVARRVREPGAAGGMDAAEHFKAVEQVENRIEQKVANFFGIANLSVTVNFRVNAERKRTRSETYDKDGVIHKPIEENERTSETTTPVAGGAGEPGALSNIGMSIQAGPAGGGQATTTETESKAKFQILAGSTTTEVETPAGIATPVAAAVRVPRSYITSVLRAEAPPLEDPNARVPEPTEQAIQARFQKDLPDFRTAVRFAAGIESEQAVLVSLYTDLIPALPGGVIPGGPNGGGLTGSAVTALATAHSREIVLGGLAVVSLFMVSMMVRRAGPVVAGVATTAGVFQTPMPVLDAAEALAGEVSESTQMLDAMELDEDAVRAQQMVDQVSSMVEENPDAAAGLVKRWLNRV